MEDPQEPTKKTKNKKPPQMKEEFNKVSEYKINIKNQFFLYTSNGCIETKM